MKVRYIGNSRELNKNQIYEVLSIESDWYRIIDNSDEDYLYSPEGFEVVEKEPIPPTIEPIAESELEEQNYG